MNFKDYWEELSQDERTKIILQKAIPIKGVEDLKRVIDESEENSLIAISYLKRGWKVPLQNDPSVVYGNIFSDITYRETFDHKFQDITQLAYSINRFVIKEVESTLFLFSYALHHPKQYRTKLWPSWGLETTFEKDFQNDFIGETVFEFLQSQGGISFQAHSSYWKIVSLFPDSKTPFLNWSDSKPWEVKE